MSTGDAESAGVVPASAVSNGSVAVPPNGALISTTERKTSGRATALAELPHYYVMELDKGMAETVAAEMPLPAEIAACEWLPDDELRVYSTEYGRTGFQGGLQWYRSVTSVSSIFGGAGINADLQLFAGLTIDQPSLFVAGTSDWGIHQRPGALERMQSSACTDMRGLHLLDGAGHWVQQEQPEAASQLVLEFLRQIL